MTTFTTTDTEGRTIPNTLHNDDLYAPSEDLGADVSDLLKEIGFTVRTTDCPNTHTHTSDTSLVAQWLSEENKLTIEYKGCIQSMVLRPEYLMKTIVSIVMKKVREVYEKGSQV